MRLVMTRTIVNGASLKCALLNDVGVHQLTDLHKCREMLLCIVWAYMHVLIVLPRHRKPERRFRNLERLPK
jgi:hypothetical protein